MMIRQAFNQLGIISTIATIALGATLVAGLEATANAGLTVVEEQTEDGHLTIYRMTVTPAREPIPALRHRLIPREIELKPGNAATHYLRAFPEGGFEHRLTAVVEKHSEDVYDWIRPSVIPLDQLPIDKARDAAAMFDGTIRNYIVPATIRRDCDWGLGIEDMRGPQIVQVLLPELNSMRSISRVLALRARVAIADGDYERAIDQLRMNYRLAENVAREPLLVASLIGIAQASIGHQQVIELIAAKDSPNLYWALVELPSPIADVKKSIRFEMSLGYRIFPFLLDAESANHAPEEWARIFAQSFADVGEITTLSGGGMSRADQELRQIAVAGASFVVYPGAKQRLIDGGMTAEAVESLPVGQVIAIDASREYRRIADEVEKWMYVPYHIARTQPVNQEFDDHGPAAINRGFGYILGSLLLPAVNAACVAEVRLDWQTSALQVVEAIRMHAADTGSLPNSLQDIEVVPVPLNPATNQSFVYRLDAQTATLVLPFSDGMPGEAWRFEITLDHQP